MFQIGHGNLNPVRNAINVSDFIDHNHDLLTLTANPNHSLAIV